MSGGTPQLSTFTLPLSFDEIIFNFVRIQGIRSSTRVNYRRAEALRRPKSCTAENHVPL